MKKCPFCAEEILEGAIKCKHCNEWLNRNDAGEQLPNLNVAKKSFSFLKYFIIWAFILSAISTFVFIEISDSKVDDIASMVFGGIIFSLFFSIVVTYIHKWIFERKNKRSESIEIQKGKKRDFLDGDIISESDSEENIKIKEQWNNFVKLFWLLFVFKIISKGAETAQDESIILILVSLQFVAIIGMVILMGYFSYKFSGKKSYWLFGLLGLLWFAIIGIFLGFFQVQRLKNQKLGIKTGMKNFRLSK